MKNIGKTLSSVLILGGLLTSAAPAAIAQTYVYPITPGYTGGYGTGYGYTGSSCLSLTAYLSLGSSDTTTGGQVSQLQQFLNRGGYLNGVTGYFDQGTYGAVVNYQIAHGIFATGSTGPVTRSAINSDSCGGYGYQNPIPTPGPIYPNDNGCYYVNGIYQCGGCNNNYNYSGYNDYNTYGNYCGINLKSVTASYSYNSMTLTLNGYGFTPSGNVVHFDGNTYTGYSSNGSRIVVTIPRAYYSGNYTIYVVNGNGASSNTLTFPISNPNSNGNIALSNINGPTNVQVGMTNTWSVNVSNNGYYNGYYSGNYPGQYTNISVDWGDGTNVSNQSVYANANQNISFSHVYNYSGNYTIRMSANVNGQYSYQTLTVYANGNNCGYNNYNGYYGWHC